MWGGRRVFMNHSGRWMLEPEGPRMQHHSFDLESLNATYLPPSVSQVPKDRVAERVEMDAQLMSPSRSRVQQDVGGNLAVSMVHLVFRYRFFGPRRAG